MIMTERKATQWIRNGEGQTDKKTLLFSKSPLKIQVAIKIFNCKRLKSI